MLTKFSYQSECHCAKTECAAVYSETGLVTSQNVTAPKPKEQRSQDSNGLVTSQNVTAPKRFVTTRTRSYSLVTSQNVTAPKLSTFNVLIFKV